MILKLTLCGLCILLVAVIAISYYTIEEGFVKKLDPKYDVIPAPEAAPSIAPVAPIASMVAPVAPLPAAPLPAAPLPEVASMVPSNAKLQGESQPAPISLPNASVLASKSSAPPQRNNVTAEVSVSDTGYTAMALQQKSDLLKDIQKMFRNELLASRATEPIGMVSHQTAHHQAKGPANGITCNETNSNADGTNDSANNSPSTTQGMEYGASSVKGINQGCPDISQYIKKDAIPCWGCSLDY